MVIDGTVKVPDSALVRLVVTPSNVYAARICFVFPFAIPHKRSVVTVSVVPESKNESSVGEAWDKATL